MEGEIRLTDTCRYTEMRAKRTRMMKMNLMEILACPNCKGDLQLKIIEKRGAEVVTGELDCQKCSQRYSIEQGIPNLLPPES